MRIILVVILTGFILTTCGGKQDNTQKSIKTVPNNPQTQPSSNQIMNLPKPISGTIKDDQVLVRESPSTQGRKLAVLKKGAPVMISKQTAPVSIDNLGTHPWYYVDAYGYYIQNGKVTTNYNMTIGWVFGAFIKK